MTAEERINQLEQALAQEQAKTARLEAENAELRQQMESILMQLQEIKNRQGKDSHNSSKPPSSDGLRRKPYPARKKSEKPSGGQAGHVGRTLMQVANADEVVHHRPESCLQCHRDLRNEPVVVKERRQVHDLPELGLWVKEHRVEAVCCPDCQQMSRGHFPQAVDAPAQYGPNVQALAVYLSHFHLLPMERTCEALSDLCDCSISEGTLANWIAEAATRLEPTIEHIKQLLLRGHFKHADETGIRIKGRLHWTHVSCTRWLTHYGWHRKRGKEALESMGIWPHFQGRAMHDRWASYDQYGCAHSLCGAHLLRDCLYLAQQEQQHWAQQIYDLLLAMNKATDQWRAQGVKAIPKQERENDIVSLSKGEVFREEKRKGGAGGMK